LMGGLRPAVLDEFGIIPAIEQLVRECRVQGDMEVHYAHNVRFDRLEPPLETTLFRIVQEALANAQWHSQTERIDVELTQHDKVLQVRIQDWGIGFDPREVEHDRFGLEGIRERARIFNGHGTIRSVPNQGTTVLVELPLA